MKLKILIILTIILISTASAALVLNYATLTGTSIVEGVSVSDINNDPIDIGGSGVLNFTCNLATFTINNDGNEPACVELITNITILSEGDCDYDLDDFCGGNGNHHGVCGENNNGNHYGNDCECEIGGLYLDYSAFPNSEDYLTDGCESYIEGGTLIIPPGGLNVTLQFTTHPLVCPATYEIEVEILPSEDCEIEPLELLTLTFTGFIFPYQYSIGTAEMEYYESSDEFYYELTSTPIPVGIFEDYNLVYYNHDGTSPPVIIATVTADGTGSLLDSGFVDLNEDLVNAHFEIYNVLNPTVSYLIGDNPINYIDTDL